MLLKLTYRHLVTYRQLSLQICSQAMQCPVWTSLTQTVTKIQFGTVVDAQYLILHSLPFIEENLLGVEIAGIPSEFAVKCMQMRKWCNSKRNLASKQ